jgi:hypothetical protein
MCVTKTKTQRPPKSFITTKRLGVVKVAKSLADEFQHNAETHTENVNNVRAEMAALTQMSGGRSHSDSIAFSAALWSAMLYDKYDRER